MDTIPTVKCMMYDRSVVHSVAGIADYWMVSEDAVYRLIKSGKLKAFKVGKEYRVTDKALREYEEGMEL